VKTVLALLAGLAAHAAFAQPAFDPFPDGSATRYRTDFRRLFPTPEAERLDRAALARKMNDIEALSGHIAADADHLLRAFELEDAVQKRYFRHEIYLDLRYAVDTRDEASRDDARALEEEMTAKTAFLNDELLRVPDSVLAEFIAQRPALERYRFAIDSIRRYAPHTLSPPEERILATTAPLGRDWPFDLYERLIARTDFRLVTADGKAFDVDRQRSLIATSPDRSLREEAFRKRYTAFASQRDLYAFALIRLATARNALARLRHYEDAASQAYFDRYWEKRDVAGLLRRVTRHADVYKRYQRLRADHVKKTMNLDEAKIWDLSAYPPSAEPPRFTIGQATRILLESTALLGPDYRRELAALLDPAQGRLDIVPGPHRRTGGFSKGFAGTDSVFFTGGFAGSYNDVRVLAHESTHAVQRQLMNRNHVLPAYFFGPNYLAESLAIFNELRLADFLFAHEIDPERKRFFLEVFLEGKGMVAFVAAPEAELEQAVYEGVAAGTVRNADDLDTLTKEIFGRYSIWPAKHEELQGEWMLVPLMYEDPFYDVNYVYGAIVGLRLFEMSEQDPASFATRFVALMRNGYDAPPSVLLKRYFDIDLDDPRLVEGGVRLLEQKLILLQRAYER
jgi:oligoendopeptidase F